MQGCNDFPNSWYFSYDWERKYGNKSSGACINWHGRGRRPGKRKYGKGMNMNVYACIFIFLCKYLLTLLTIQV